MPSVKIAAPAAHAAGTVLYRQKPKGPQLLLIHRPKYGDWSLPKGHLDPGETYLDAAHRETFEETGITGEIGDLVGSIGYRVGRGQKVVRYYLMEAEGGRFVPNDEADDAQWLSPKRALNVATYERDRAIIRRAASMLDTTTTGRIYLVRHAMAGRRALWTGPDIERPLSGVGKRQAVAVTRGLLEYPVTQVLSSPFVRCVESVAPLATAIDVKVRPHAALEEGAGVKAFLKLVRKLKSDSAVLCSHGDVITRVIEHLASEGVPLKGGLAWRKGSVWELDLVDGRVVKGTYVPPP